MEHSLLKSKDEISEFLLIKKQMMRKRPIQLPK